MADEGLTETYNTAKFLGKIKDSDQTCGHVPVYANDVLVLKACLVAIDRYFTEHGVRVPVIVSGTLYHPGGRTLFSQTPEAFYVSVSHFDALAVGFNCGVGVDLLRPAVESLIEEAIARNNVPFAPAGRGSVVIRSTSAKQRRQPKK